MITALIAVGAFVFYVLAYHTYGRWLARKIFQIDPEAKTPAMELEDGVDFVPSQKEVVFGHHFTSIAGTGPIVGPAIAIIWGWLPALLWVLIGSVVMGAVHDFGALVMSLRSRGVSIADLAGSVVNRRVRVLFISVVYFELLIVVAIFALVIASVFAIYPQSVMPVWLEIPIAVALGSVLVRARSARTVWIASIIAVVIMYITVVIGAYMPLKMPELFGLPPTLLWAVVLFVYAFVASVLPVHRLLQPRDFINSHQLFIAMGLLLLGVLVARPEIVAPASQNVADAPPFVPFLFITIACGAISGFHALVGSGTSSKQLRSESHAQLVGYGSMLTEGFLAVLVICACAAGLGMRYSVREFTIPGAGASQGEVLAAQDVYEGFREQNPDIEIEETMAKDGAKTYAAVLRGKDAWNEHYKSWDAAGGGLKPKLRAFVDGSANMMAAFGLPMAVGLAVIGVFVASFAGTTLDTATRLQRYIVSEFGSVLKVRWLENRYLATSVAVGTAAALALWDGKGAGAMVLWPLFGALNQLLASLALLVIAVYLHRRNKPTWLVVLPFCFMLMMTGWAMIINVEKFMEGQQWHLLVISVIVLALQVWITIEAAVVWLKACKGAAGEGAAPAP